MNIRSLMQCCAYSALIIATLNSATAQDTDANSAGAEADKRLDTITVTATKREQNLQDVPVAVTAISGDLLESTGTGSVENLSAVAPSVTFTQSSNDQNNSVNIRGIGTSVFSQGVESSVSIVLDDVVMPRQAVGFQDLVDVERVEILRGPQSTLFGKNASAGVISVTTAAPSDQLEGKVRISAAESDEFNFGATVSGALSDSVGARLTGFYKEFDGHISNFDGRNLNGYENWGLRGKIRIEPSDAFDLTFTADYRESDQDCCVYTVRDTSGAVGAAQGLDALLTPIEASSENARAKVGAPVFNNSEQGGLSARANYEFENGFVLTSISAIRDYDFENNLDVDALDLEEPVLGFITFDVNSGTTDIEQISQEFRLTSPEGESYDYVLGGYASKLNLERDFSRRFEILTPLFGGFRINQSGQFTSAVETVSLAVFGRGNWHISDRSTLFGGLRVLSEEHDYQINRDPADVLFPGDLPFDGVVGTVADVDDSTSDSTVTGEIGVRLRLSSNVTGYARYARGYKGRAIDVTFTAPNDVEPIEAETSDAFEIGIKSVLANGKLILNTAAFHTEFQDFQEQATVLLADTDSVLSAETRLTNVGSVSTSGIEIEAIARPTDLLTLQAGLSYTDAKIDDFPNAGCYFGQTVSEGCAPILLSDGGTPNDPSDDILENLQDLSGGDLPNAPDWRFTGTVRQDIPLEASFDGFVQLSGHWQSDVNFSLGGDPRATQPSYGILNLALGIVDDQGRYSATVFVNNVLDEFYVANVFGDPVHAGVVSHYAQRDFARYAGIKLSADF